MHDYEFFPDDIDRETEFDIPHLPLDWNEDLTLEEYLERMERQSNKIYNSL